jgi:arylsulfatase A-like enzyme
VRFHHDAPHPVDPDKIADYVRLGDSIDGRDYVDAYDGEIAYTDREVGRLLDGLDALGLGDDALIVLTADHGEFLLERDDLLFCHGFSVDQAVIHVPLIIRHPKIRAGRIGDAVSIADVTPTVLDVLGLPLPPGLDGSSLAGTALRDAPPYAEGPDPTGSGGLERAHVYSQRKLVVRHGRDNEPRAAWTVDAGRGDHERRPAPLDAADSEFHQLSELVRMDPDPGGRPQRASRHAPSSTLVADVLPAEVLEKLRGLGYVK